MACRRDRPKERYGDFSTVCRARLRTTDAHACGGTDIWPGWRMAQPPVSLCRRLTVCTDSERLHPVRTGDAGRWPARIRPQLFESAALSCRSSSCPRLGIAARGERSADPPNTGARTPINRRCMSISAGFRSANFTANVLIRSEAGPVQPSPPVCQGRDGASSARASRQPARCGSPKPG